MVFNITYMYSSFLKPILSFFIQVCVVSNLSMVCRVLVSGAADSGVVSNTYYNTFLVVILSIHWIYIAECTSIALLWLPIVHCDKI